MNADERTSDNPQAMSGGCVRRIPRRGLESVTGEWVEPGRLERVDPREVWPHEALDFTPWLPANADVQGDPLGMELELTEAERQVGGFLLDLVAAGCRPRSTSDTPTPR